MTTERLVLREMTDDDLQDVADLLGDPEVMRFYPRPKTREEAQLWIDRNRQRYREHGFGLWATVEKSSGGPGGKSGKSGGPGQGKGKRG